MKRIVRFFSFVLIGILIITMFSGCGETKKQTVQKKVIKYNTKPEFSFTEFDFLKNGKTDYVIVIPSDCDEKEKFAAEELQHFIEESSGYRLPIENDKANINNPYISIGNTAFSEKVNVKPEYKEVKTNGFVMKTVDKNLYLKGFDAFGTRNSVYEFLYYYFDFECYASDEIYVKKIKDLKLPDLDETVNPTFEWRNVTCGEYIVDTETSARMRLTTNDEKFVTGALCHNTMTIIDPKEYDYTSNRYKAWYSEAMATDPLDSTQTMRPAQLCFSNAEMVEEFIKNLIPKLVESNAPLYLLGMEDNVEWCTCKDCTASKEKYGTDSAVMIHFANKVQRAINDYFEKNLPKRTPIKIIFFAYYNTVKPPVSYNKAEKCYEPIDETVIMDDDIGIMYAPINASFGVPLTDSNNKDYAEYIEGWSILTKNIHIWIYNLHTSDGLILHNTCESMQPNYQYLAEHGAVGILDQMDSYQSGGNTAFTRARSYVGAKLRFNAYLNQEELYKDFFKHYFDDASETMYDLFNSEREWITHIYDSTSLTGKINERMNTEEYWTYPWLLSAMKKIDKAYADIKPLQKSNPERYAVLHERINLESIQFRFLLIEVFGTRFTAKELYDMKYSFKKDFERLGIVSYAEHHNISELWNAWSMK